jgi:hypothetical protein
MKLNPYARLRPGTSLGEGVRIGNFVETKAATLEAGAKVNYLSYVGANANLGAGTITCNYDGFFKHKTAIGTGARRGKISKRRAGRPSLIDAADSHAALPPALPVPEALGNPVAGRDRLSNRGIDIARPVRSAAWWSGISARIRIAAGSVIIARLCNRG